MTQNNFKIAVTGGIGSGKSAVCKIIESEGYPVFSCDKIYAELTKDKTFVSKLEAEFGDVSFEDGTLDRKKLAKIVFGNRKKLHKLNEITHPEIMKEARKRMSAYPISFCEVPVLFESSLQDAFDGVIVVLREMEKRIRSIVERDKVPEQFAVLRIKSQFNYDNCDLSEYYVIHNDGNFDDLTTKVREIINQIQSK